MSDKNNSEKLFNNWRQFLKEEKLEEVVTVKYSGEVADKDDPLQKWDPSTIIRTPLVVREPEKIDANSPKPWVKALALTGGAIFAGWTLWKTMRLMKRIGGQLLAFFRGKPVTMATAGAFARIGWVARALAVFGISSVVAAGAIYALYKIISEYGDVLGISAAEAVDNPEGPGTKEYADDVARGLVSLNVQSWQTVDEKIRCAWCKQNPGREHIGTYNDNVSDKVKKALKDVQKNGPFCKDILKKNSCKDLDVSKLSKKLDKQYGSSSNLSSQSLSGPVTTFSSLGIEHNLTGERKTIAEMYLNSMIKLGIKNKYVLAGALAVSGKESGFLGKAEGARYGFERLRNKKAKGNTAVANRTRAVFRHQLGREPNDEEWRQLSKENGLKGGIALFNIAYGYESLGKGVYTTYQEDKAIPHSLKVISAPGVINPSLFNPELAGYKYRGRGNIQITFKENYRKTAALAGLDVQQIVDNPDLLITNPKIGVLMNAARTKGSYNKTSNNLQKRGLSGNPNNLLDGIKFMAMLAGGGAGNPNHSWFKRAVNRAVEQANKHIRIVGEQGGAIV